MRSWSDGRLTVEVLESFGNCPQHITPRNVHVAPMEQHPELQFSGISADARAIIARSDTFFIASTGGAHGVDISHRGGQPGFAAIDGNSLVVRDFKGNRFSTRSATCYLMPELCCYSLISLVGTCSNCAAPASSTGRLMKPEVVAGVSIAWAVV